MAVNLSFITHDDDNRMLSSISGRYSHCFMEVGFIFMDDVVRFISSFTFLNILLTL